MAPIDQGYLKMLNDIVLLIVGGIGGVMSRKGVQTLAEKISSSTTTPPTATFTPGMTTTPAVVPNNSMPVWVNPALDEEWRAPPPPTTPPDFIDPAKEEIAQERAAARSET